MAAKEKKPQNNHLFTRDNGDPIVFYMRPCAQKVTLKPLVEAGGGEMTVKVTRNCIKLAVEADQISTDDYISSKYIQDCVNSSALLPLDKYRLKPKKRSADLSVDEIDVLDDLSPATKIQRTEALPLGRSKYSLQDDMAILKYFEKNNNLVTKYNGLKIWHDMSLVKVTDHSAESMKDRFKKRILPNIDSYNVSSSIKFLLTKKTKFLADSDHSLRQKSKKPATEMSPKKNLTLSDHTDSFDQFLLESMDNSPKKGSNSHRFPQLVLDDVMSSKSGKEKASPMKVTVPQSTNISKENKDSTKQSVHKPAQLDDHFSNKTKSTKQASQKTSKTSDSQSPEKVDQNVGPSLRKRKLFDTKDSKDTASRTSEETSKVTLRKRPKTNIHMSESQPESSSSRITSEKTLPGLTRDNVLKYNGHESTPDKDKRLNYVMEKFLESQDDEVSSPSEHVIHDSEKVNSDEEDEDNNVTEEEVEETMILVQKMMKQYGLKAEYLLHAFYINNGNYGDTVSWIETGLDTTGLPPWDHRDDNRLMSNDFNTLEALKEKYGLKRVNNRLLFLEGF